MKEENTVEDNKTQKHPALQLWVLCSEYKDEKRLKNAGFLELKNKIINVNY